MRCGCPRARPRTSSPKSTPPWSKPWATRACARGSPSWGRKSRRARTRICRRCTPTTRPRSRSGGRSSRRRTSRRNDAGHRATDHGGNGMRKLSMANALAALLAAMGGAAAQVYPSRPITIIVPFPAGGATDSFARILAEPLRASLGQPIVIENIGGAAGSLGVGRAARAPADGHTLSIGTSTTPALIGALYTLQFDLMKDLEPIAQLAAEPLLIVAKKGMPANDLRDMIAWLKANPDKASAGIAGVGATGHVTG